MDQTAFGLFKTSDKGSGNNTHGGGSELSI